MNSSMRITNQALAFLAARYWRMAGLPLLLLWSGCGGSGGGPDEPPPTPVILQIVTTNAVQETLAAVGTVAANEIVQLKPETPAVVRTIHFIEGQQVTNGQRLFELDAGKEAAMAAQARAEEALARQNLERARALIGTKAISSQELDQREGELAARIAARQLQEERLQDMTIVAPFAGVLGPRQVSPGQYVNAGQDLVTLVDNSQVKVSYRVPEQQLAQFRVGQEVTLRVGAYPERVFPGKVDLLNPVVDEATRTAEIRALVPNPDTLLKPGMFARVETIIDRRDCSIVVPETALIPSLRGFSVYTVKEGRARLTPVRIGVRAEGTVEIRQGLAAGEEIVVEGTQKLVDGMPVVGAKA